MKYTFLSIAAISGLLFVSAPLSAQEHDFNQVFQKVQNDIQLPSVNAVLSEEDEYSVSLMNRDLAELQQNSAVCQCDQRIVPAYTDVVNTLQRAVYDHRIDGRDREVLQIDLNLLRGTTYQDTQAYKR